MSYDFHSERAQYWGIKTDTACRENLWAVVLGLQPFTDGDQYCFLYGENIHNGVAGFGSTVYDAMYDFEKSMTKSIACKKNK